MNATFAPRDRAFSLDRSRIADWLAGDDARTVFLNALSLLFPAGERFFIASVARYRDRIDDPTLAHEARAFVAQEALHTREHVAYNDALASVCDAPRLERDLGEHLAWVQSTFSRLDQLAMTCALEHFTAIMAREVLNDPAYLRGALPDYATLWAWHALEECEHKAVAFDVFERVTDGRRAGLRLRIMAMTTITFVRFISKNVGALMHARGLGRSPVAWARLLWYVFGYPGIARRIVVPYLRYYEPTFHPRQIDDRSALARGKHLVDAVA